MQVIMLKNLKSESFGTTKQILSLYLSYPVLGIHRTEKKCDWNNNLYNRGLPLHNILVAADNYTDYCPNNIFS